MRGSIPGSMVDPALLSHPSACNQPAARQSGSGNLCCLTMFCKPLLELQTIWDDLGLTYVCHTFRSLASRQSLKQGMIYLQFSLQKCRAMSETGSTSLTSDADSHLLKRFFCVGSWYTGWSPTPWARGPVFFQSSSTRL